DGRLNLPLLAAPEGVQLDINSLSTPQQFTSLTRTWYLRLNAGVCTMTLPSVNHIRNIIAMGNGTKLSFPNVTAYTQPNNTNVTWRAGDISVTNVDCELNFPNLITISGGVTTTSGTNFFFDITARNNAMINLPQLITITVPAETVTNATSGVRLYALSTGVLNAARLSNFTDQTVPGISRIEASADSFYTLTSLRQTGISGIVLSGVSLATGPVVLIPPAITSAPSVNAITGNMFSYQITATNTPYGFDLNPIPSGLRFNPDTGMLSGIPTIQGTQVLAMRAFNADGIATRSLTLTFTAPPAVNPPTDLYAWWKADVDGRDALGTLHGTLQGGVAIQPGRVGNAFTFTTIGQGVSLPQSPGLDLSRRSAWTVEAWIYPTSFTGSTYPTIYSLGDFCASLGLNSAGRLESWINNSNRLNTTPSVTLNAWSHVAMSYNGTNRVFFINGVNVGSGVAPAITDVDAASSIGNVTGSPSDSQFFGQIDELAVYGRALTDAEILSIHASGITGKSLPPSTFASWRNINFTPANLLVPTISGPDADPDSDGLQNILEYALGMNPMRPGTQELPTMQIAGGTITYRYLKRRSDVNYTVITSTRLEAANWTSAGVNQGVPDSQGFVTASTPTNGGKRFLRLRVQLVP
ncbi:MAG: LamG domain-containing protein, partial [Verrucomicrobia bacterium]